MVSLAVSQRFQLLGVSSLMSSDCRRLLAIIVSVVCPYLSVRKCIAICLLIFWRVDVDVDVDVDIDVLTFTLMCWRWRWRRHWQWHWHVNACTQFAIGLLRTHWRGMAFVTRFELLAFVVGSAAGVVCCSSVLSHNSNFLGVHCWHADVGLSILFQTASWRPSKIGSADFPRQWASVLQWFDVKFDVAVVFGVCKWTAMALEIDVQLWRWACGISCVCGSVFLSGWR